MCQIVRTMTLEQKYDGPDIVEMSENVFSPWFAKMWNQGEHCVVLGPTGSGKTRYTSTILAIRSYVCVLAVKAHDDTLEQFKQRGYRLITHWPPPDYKMRHVILWIKPKSLTATKTQSIAISEALESMYLSGGWCIYFDEAGYIAGHLKLDQELGILLNQGRSSGISVVCSMTRPHSVVGKVPLETLNQTRHQLIFKYQDEREIEACAKITGLSKSLMIYYMRQLKTYKEGHTDFVYVGKGYVILVRR